MTTGKEISNMIYEVENAKVKIPTVKIPTERARDIIQTEETQSSIMQNLDQALAIAQKLKDFSQQL
jgi:hypothetical protein